MDVCIRTFERLASKIGTKVNTKSCEYLIYLNRYTCTYGNGRVTNREIEK